MDMMYDKRLLIKRIVETSFKAKEGHIPSSLSVLDILLVIYGKILSKDDTFILSKGHASLGIYAVLEHFNLLDDCLDDMCKFNSKLGGHPSIMLNNITASTGSLGHGLPIGLGIALERKINERPGRSFVIIGDGEANEGTVWESALLAANHNLNNLCCIMDYNRSNDRALKLDDVKSKFESFNWDCVEIDGHNQEEIEKALTKDTLDKPLFILANTIKGKGISFMENNHEWHHKAVTVEDIKRINEELS